MDVQTLVVDSSVVVKWLVTEKEDFLEQADLLLRDIQAEGSRIAVPELAKYEIANALRYKSMTEEQKVFCLTSFYSLPVFFYGLSLRQSVRVLNWAESTGITYYDAAFVELAQRLKTRLITANPKHQGKAEGVEVIALADYPTSL